MTEPRVDRKHLGESVAAGAPIDALDRERLDTGAVADIPHALHVGGEPLRDAQRALVERHLAREQARRRLLVVVAAGLMALAALGAALLSERSYERSLDAVGVSRADVERDGQPARGPLAHDPSVRLSFEVMLDRLPETAVIELACQWIDPTGRERYTSRWSTKPIEHDHWPTRCGHEFDAHDAAGSWSVTMSLGARRLATGQFQLQ
ncbi:MAG TPA: hypothetical protein VMG12_08485 [Polyangiaceae bacterium]|nr:hypothetical protein [Polyangiaceae bacterium]